MAKARSDAAGLFLGGGTGAAEAWPRVASPATQQERPAAGLRAFRKNLPEKDQVAAGKVNSSVRAFRKACSLKRSVRIVMAREDR